MDPSGLGLRLRLGVQGVGLCVQGGGGDNGRSNDRVVHAVALHIAHKGLSHGLWALPPVCGVEGGCLQNDGCHFVVGVGRGRQGVSLQPPRLSAILGLCKGPLASVIYQVEHHTQGIQINGAIHFPEVVKQLRRSKGAPVLGGEGGICKVIQGQEAEVTHLELTLGRHKNVFRL